MDEVSGIASSAKPEATKTGAIKPEPHTKPQPSTAPVADITPKPVPMAVSAPIPTAASEPSWDHRLCSAR